MPRTKQRKVKRTSSAGYEPILRDFNRLVQLRINKLEVDYRAKMERLDTQFQLAINCYPPEIQNMTLRELMTIDMSPKKENLPPKTPKTTNKSSMKPKRVTAASDDGYISESQASQASKLTTGIKRRTRSTSRDTTTKRTKSVSRDRKSKMNQTNTLKPSKKDVMKTPNNRTNNAFTITPKVKLNSAINVLRKPKEGEMVISMQGSPLLVSTTVNDRTANINVPLRNGNIVSLLPFNETSLTENIHLDEETKQQLMILQSHLAKVLK